MTTTTTKPATYHIQRTASIKAPPEKIFPLINDFHAFNTWSPFDKMDPALKRAYRGAASGKGAVYEYDSQTPMGAGRLEIVESSAPSRIKMTLDVLRPFQARNTVEFRLEPKGAATNVIWAMQGPLSTNDDAGEMDKMIGKDFEAGLADLKALAEK